MSLTRPLCRVLQERWDGKVACYAIMVLCNVVMWSFYVRSLKALTSLQATVVNFASNFLLSGMAGFLLFNEPAHFQVLFTWSSTGRECERICSAFVEECGQVHPGPALRPGTPHLPWQSTHPLPLSLWFTFMSLIPICHILSLTRRGLWTVSVVYWRGLHCHRHLVCQQC